MMLEKMANVGFRGINRLSLPMTMRRIMGKALQHASRPEQAISVAMDGAARGTESVPPLLRNMFAWV